VSEHAAALDRARRILAGQLELADRLVDQASEKRFSSSTAGTSGEEVDSVSPARCISSSSRLPSCS
jgi:hypothetical protein